MPLFRKKPVVIEARKFTCTTEHEGDALAAWCHGLYRGTRLPPEERVIRIETLESTLEASFGDWIIKGISGEFYPCKPDIFEKTYEQVDDLEAKGVPFRG